MKTNNDLQKSGGVYARRPWKRPLLGLVALIVVVIVGLAVWLLLPVKRVPVTQLLPSKPFAFFTIPLDTRDPAMQGIVSGIKGRLVSGQGFVRRTLVNLLLPSALPVSVSAVVATDPGTGDPQMLVYADIGRLSRFLRLGGASAAKLLLRGGPVARERVAGQTIRSRSGGKGPLSFSAYAVVGGTLVMGTSRTAVLDICAQYPNGGQESGARSAFREKLKLAQGGRDASLSVDNGAGGMSRLVDTASAKYSFAAFPSIGAVATISGSLQMLPDTIGGTLAFVSASPAQVEGIRSDVQFIYGALKRVARAAGLGMKGEVNAQEGAVLFHFQLPGYMEALSAPGMKKEGEKK